MKLFDETSDNLANAFANDFGMDNTLKEEDGLEVTFEVRDDFAKLFKGIKKYHEKTGFCENALSLTDMVGGINNFYKVIDKECICNKYTFFPQKSLKFKKRKKLVKKYFGKLAVKVHESMIQDGYTESVACPGYEVTSIEAKGNALYCRVKLDKSVLDLEMVLKEVGCIIGTYAKDVKEVVWLKEPGFDTEYTPLSFEVSNDKLLITNDKKVMGTTKDVTTIRLIDETKVYMVEADIRIPDELSEVIKKIDAVERIIDNDNELTPKAQVIRCLEKLYFYYDPVHAFLEYKSYYTDLCFMFDRDYQREQLIKEVDKDLKPYIVNGLHPFTNAEEESAIYDYSLRHNIVEVKENTFGDDFKHWRVKATFGIIDKKDLEKIFDRVKKNMISNNVPEHEIKINITEVQQ